jgi:secreted Zn-dependent insulinase-like peptidase
MQPRFTVLPAVRFALLLALAVLAACAVPEPQSSLAPVQSPNDRFAYRLITLDNGLKALLISNPEAPKAAASLDVQVGSGDNPAGRGGLAHFLEHMLFLGTEKYPDAAEYERYITEHGGTRNAYTSFEHTNYFFDIDPEHFSGALDRFAQFFIAPNFDANYVERERNAVEAEFQMGLKSDPRRGLDVLQASMNPQHPFSQFAVGSLDSLADRPESPVRDELIAFYEKYYSANVMRLAVLGREPLDRLEAMAREAFAAVPNRNTVLQPVDEPMFVEAQLPMLLKIKPQGTARQLELNFQVPDDRPNYDAKPMAYISNLVGHEGEGSLLSLLKRESLADGLSSGTGLYWRGGALFSISIGLTEKGVANYERVLQQTFAYLEMLREEGPKGWIYDEQATLSSLAFRFREPSAPMGYVSSLSNAMHYYDDEDLLRGPYLMTEFDASAIKSALAALRPERAQVILTAPELATDRVSPHYAVPYSQLGPEAVMLARWKTEENLGLHLPEPNPFIADDVSLLPVAADNPPVPRLQVDEERKRIWYRQASDFRVPKGAMYLSFRSPLASESPQQKAASTLYTRMVSDALNEYTYPALLAGLGFNFYNHMQGISMRVSGYNDKQLMLLDELLSKVAAQKFDAQRFARIRRELVLDLQNTVARRPSSQLLDDLRQALVSGSFSEEDLIAALERMDIDDLDAYRRAFWASARAEGLLYGNYPAEAVGAVANTVDIVLGEGGGEPAVAPLVLKIAPSTDLQLESEIEHDDAVVAWYLQGGGQSWRDRAMVSLTAQIVQSGFFQQLRTEQQMGYIVSSFPWSQYDVPGLMLLIQSPSHSAVEVSAAMATFLKDTLAEISEDQFLRHRQALINDILKPDENLSERAEFYWQAIASREWGFDGPDQLATAVSGISFEDWQRDYRALFLEQRRSLLALSPGAKAATPESGAQRFRDPAQLRAAFDAYTASLSPL